MLIAFRNTSFSVGVDSLDAQHRNILQLLDSVIRFECSTADDRLHLRKYLQVIRYYTDAHFMYEETLLTLVNYADFREHALLHLEMQGMIWAALAAPIHEDSPDLAELFNSAIPWWIDHIMTDDKKYMPILSDSYLFLAAA